MLEDERRFDREVLEAAVGRGEANVRVRAAHAAGSIGDPRALPILASLAADGDAGVRAAAALGEEILGDPRSLPTLTVLLHQTDASVVCAASRAIARLHEGESEEVLIEATRTAPTAARPCLFHALAAYSTESAAAAAEISAANASGELRRAAVYAFCRNPIPVSASAIASALKETDADSAAFAARALGVLGSPDGIPALAAALDRVETAVLASVLTAIEQIESRQPTPLPRDRIARIVALASDANPSVAIPALTALRRFTDDRDAIRTLDAQAVSGAGRRREVALVSIIRGLKEKSKSKLDLAVASSEVGIRAAAAEGLAGLPETFAAPYRTRLLSDPNPHVRELALDVTPADSAHRDAIRSMLSDPDAGVRSAAIDRLADTRDATVIADLGPALAASRGDTIPDAALSAISAAAAFGSEPARAVLTSALSDSRPLVSRFGRQQLIEAFHSDPSTIPAAVYSPGRSAKDYARILEDAARPRRATVRTSRGTIVISLDGSRAPLTVENFVVLAGRHFFDGTTFDRVVPNFVVQGGDPTATQHGGPGYEIRDEITAGSFDPGAVGMALGGPDTGGSQFFITLAPEPHLDGRYPLFGKVVAGQDVVERIEQGDRILSVMLSGS